MPPPDFDPRPEFERGLKSLEAIGQGILARFRNPGRTLREIAQGVKQADQQFQENYDKTFLPGGKVNQAALPQTVDQAMSLTGMAPAGIFAGMASKMFDPQALREALHMTTKKVDPARIWEETGWGKAPDGNWKYEIDDSPANLLLRTTGEPSVRRYTNLDHTEGEVRGQLLTGQGGPLGKASETIYHPELFKAYPHLDNTSVVVRVGPGEALPGRSTGSYSPSPDSRGGQMISTAAGPVEALQTMLHELQHGVQKQQRWQGGSNPQLFYKATDGDPHKAFQIYKHAQGEAEARLTESRMNLTQAERRNAYNFPFSNENFFAATGVDPSELLNQGQLMKLQAGLASFR